MGRIDPSTQSSLVLAEVAADTSFLPAQDDDTRVPLFADFRASRHIYSRRFPVMMRRTTPVLPIGPAEPLSRGIGGRIDPSTQSSLVLAEVVADTSFLPAQDDDTRVLLFAGFRASPYILRRFYMIMRRTTPVLPIGPAEPLLRGIGGRIDPSTQSSLVLAEVAADTSFLPTQDDDTRVPLFADFRASPHILLRRSRHYNLDSRSLKAGMSDWGLGISS